MKKIALAYAMEGEIESLLAAAGTNVIDRGDGALLVYEIQPGIIAYAGGIGKVNAAMSAQFVIDRHRPDWIVNAGVAGSFLDLPIGTVVLAKGFVQHDVDTTAMGDPIGMVSTVNQIYFPTDGLKRADAILTDLGVAHEIGDVATGRRLYGPRGPGGLGGKDLLPHPVRDGGLRHRPGLPAQRGGFHRSEVRLRPAVPGEQRPGVL